MPSTHLTGGREAFKHVKMSIKNVHKAFEEHIAHCAGISAQPARDTTTQEVYATSEANVDPTPRICKLSTRADVVMQSFPCN